MGKKKKSKNVETSKIREAMKVINKKIYDSGMEKKELQCQCIHKSHNKGKFWLSRTEERTVFKCKECRSKIDFAPVADDKATRDDIRDYVKGTTKELLNMANIVKVVMDSKYDDKVIKFISKMMYNVIKFRKFAEAVLADGLKPNKRNKKGKDGSGKKKKRGFRLEAAGNSFRH